jgi:hypothetical protein
VNRPPRPEATGQRGQTAALPGEGAETANATTDNTAMNFQKILLPIGGVLLVAFAYRGWGWLGVGLASAGLVMWLLLHFTRLMTILKRAADRPLGYVDSAVMLNARLKRGKTLMHVIAMTRALGALQTPKDTQPEVFRWTDPGHSWVDCEFRHGRLVQWSLVRPAEVPDAPPPSPRTLAAPEQPPSPPAPDAGP